MAISSYTEFFRTRNIPPFTEKVAPALARAQGQLRIAEVGCSTGKETWSIAAALAVREVSFYIDAFDAKASVLHEAQLPYRRSLQGLARVIEKNGFPRECLDYFEVSPSDTRFIQPKVTLRPHAAFEARDIGRQPLAKQRYGAVVVNNMLHHYRGTPNEQHRLVANMLTGLRPGGVLLCDNFAHRDDRWTLALPQYFPLEPVKEVGRWRNSILRYQP